MIFFHITMLTHRDIFFFYYVAVHVNLIGNVPYEPLVDVLNDHCIRNYVTKYIQIFYIDRTVIFYQ